MWTGTTGHFASSPSATQPSSSAVSVTSNSSNSNNGDDGERRPAPSTIRTRTGTAFSASAPSLLPPFSSSALSSSSSAAPPPPPLGMMHGGSAAAAMVVTDESSRGASSLFSWQKLSLDRAVAPLLKDPVAPFVSRNHERKRALLNATYYSECFLHAIRPMDADTAALDAQSRYEKWWVESKYRGDESSGHTEEGRSSGSSNKRRKVTAVQSGPATAAAVQIRDDREDSGNCSDGTRKRSVSPIHSIPDAIVDHDHDHDDACDSSDLPRAPSIAALKAALVEDLRQSGGDVSAPHFVSCLDALHELYQASKKDERWGPSSSGAVPSDGTWIALSKPTFTECRGRNDRGQCLYTLGRLSFDMFRPTSLLCSLRGVFNTVSLPEDAVTTGTTSNASTSSIGSGDDEPGDGDRGGRDASGRGAASAASASVEDGASSASASMRRPRTCPSRMVRSLQDRYGKAGAPVRNYEYVRYSCRFNLLLLAFLLVRVLTSPCAFFFAQMVRTAVASSWRSPLSLTKRDGDSSPLMHRRTLAPPCRHRRIQQQHQVHQQQRCRPPTGSGARSAAC
jgi:hypothetical protein